MDPNLLGFCQPLQENNHQPGCEAARVSALRGHNVILHEKKARLGGNVIPGGTPDFKEDDHLLAKWYETELRDLNIELHLNSEVTKDIVMDAKADVVIVATGSTPKVFNIGDSNKVFTAEEVLEGRKDPGESVVIIGGGLVGCETALWLADQGKPVTIVEMQSDILKVGGPLCHANTDMLKALVPFKGIDLRTNTVVTGVTEDGFILKSGDKEEIVKADSAILAVGYNSQKDLYEQIRFDVPEVHLLGDARQVQNIMYAIWDAYEVARDI